jgi:hypothetical protein
VSVVLCGLRDVRDYKAFAGGNPTRLGTASPFNVAVESIRIGDFTRDQVAELYGQRTADSWGVTFTISRSAGQASARLFSVPGRPAVYLPCTWRIPGQVESGPEQQERATPRRCGVPSSASSALSGIGCAG